MIPQFDAQRLDALMDEAGIDVVLASSKFNLQYLLGGYRYFFFENMDAIGLSRYLPILGYRRGQLQDAFYVGAGNEDWGTDVWDFWVPDVQNVAWTSVRAAEVAAAALRARHLEGATIAIETSFLPADAMDCLRADLPNARFVSAQRVLEELRSVKTPAELELIAAASEKVVDSFIATFAAVGPGMTKQQIGEVLRQEQTRRGLVYDYVLVACGTDFNRAPAQARVWNAGEVLSLDSGGMYRGYIGDLARMGIAGDPTKLQVELLEDLELVQQAARTAIFAGNLGGEIYVNAEAALGETRHATELKFVAHAMGLISHEAPRLTATGPIPYPADHAKKPLETGMVLSIESWTEHRAAGFIKLEDTLIVTDAGWQAPGDTARGWNRCSVS